MYGKKILSLALTLMLLTGSINGYAASDDPVSDTETEFSDEYSVSLASSGGNDNESVEKPNPGQGHGSDKKDITGVLESGNISWSLSNAGMLTLSGNGAMDSFGETLAPWSEYKQSVKFIYVSDGITTIGDYAFYDLGDVKSVYIPESVEAIGSSAFEKCGKLKEISLSKGLKTIGEAAFKYCSELKDVNIPKNVEAISATAFSNCDKLRDINVDKHNNNYSSVDGVLFNTDATVLVSYPDGKKETDYTVPQGVTAIGEYAFDDCEKLSDVVLPNTLTTIGGNAFYGCSGIEKINIPASVTDIAHSAFLYECSSLKEINVDENNIVYSSELGVLFDKDKTKLIRFPAQCEAAVDEGMYVAPKTLKIIGQEAFLDCRTIELLWIHGSLEKIEMAAFMNLDSLMEIWFDGTIYNWELVEKDILNDKLNEIPVSCMEGELEKEFQAKVGVTYYLEDFVDLKDNEALLESLVVSSSNPDVAVVDNEKMTAISEGEAIITAIVNDAGITYAAAVKVIVTQDGSNDKSGAFELVEGETMDLKKALSVPDEFLNSLVWNSSNQGVATVDNGVVNAVDAGSAVVIATVNSESTLSYSIRCTITVEPKYTNEEYFEFNNGTITKYIGSDTEVDIPLTIGGIEVTAIGENAFKYCNHVTKVELPQTVTSIGNGAFSYCSSLSNISLHEGITYIGNYAFSNCSSLIKMTIPSSVSNEGNYWFAGSERLNTVEFAKGTVTIGSGLRNSSVKKVVMPSTVTTIENYAFSYCTSLKNMQIPDSVTSIGENVFYGCSKLTDITIGKGIKYITSNLFAGCPVKNINLSEGIQSIGDYAFENCSLLENIKIPDSVTSIGNYAFRYCSSLQKVEFGNSLKTIGQCAFEECSSLESIKIPDSVASIDNYAFRYCSSLGKAELGNGLRTIGDKAFYNCSSLESIEIPNSVNSVGISAFYGCTKLTDITIGSGIVNITSSMFTGCSVKNITLSKGVQTIGYSAFSGCTSLESITLPDSLVSIGRYAFNNCIRLKQIVVGNGLERIDNYAFSGCSKIESITLPDSVIYIGDYAFKECTSLKKVQLGSSLEQIGNGAFYGCASLDAVKIPDTVIYMGYNAFYNCTGLNQLELGDGLQTIGNYAFYGCTSLNNIKIPDSVTAIGNRTFYNCTSLNQVEFGTGLKTIGDYAFYKCTLLGSIKIPDSVTSIGIYAFAYCSSLKNAELGIGLELVSPYAFYRCTSLESIEFPESVTSIGNYAFAYCTMLSDVQIVNSLCSFGYGVFSGCSKLSSAADVSAEYEALSEEVVGYFPMQIEYDIKSNSFVTGKEIIVNLPDSAYLVSGSMKLDGELYNNYNEYENVTYSSNKITINLEKDSGVLTFCIKPGKYGQMSTSATVNIKSLAGNKSTLIGTVYFSMPEITIATADTTGKPEVIAEGTAIPNRNISLYVDDVYQKTVRSNSSGTYKSSVSIENPENYREYKITAEIVNDNDETVSADTNVQYLSDTPSLEGLTMYYGKDGGRKNCYDLYNAAVRPIIAWGDYYTSKNRGYSYSFAVDISQRDTIDKVYVVSTRNNTREYLEAKWDSETQCYVTSGYFANDCEYIPGVLTVEYTKLSDGTKTEFSDISAYLGFEETSFMPSVTDYTTTSFSAVVAVEDTLQEIFGNEINISAETIDRDYTEVNKEELCPDMLNCYSYPLTKENGEYVISFDFTDSANAVIYIHDITQNKQTTYNMSFVSMDEEGESNISIADVLNRADEYAGKILNVYNLNFDIQGITEGMRMSGLSQEEIDKGIEIAEELDLKKQMFVMTATVLSASSVDGISAPSQILDYILDIIEEDVAYFRNLRLLNIFKIGSECKVRWKIDPSGYVYEGVTDNRLEGVTATIYFLDPDDMPKNDDGSEDYDNIDSSKIQKWDASEFDQENSIVTGTDGVYSWDVPEGYWQVKFEKDGYETGYSEWMTVPPVQTDINIGLVSKSAPVVEKAYLTSEYLVLTFDKYMKPDTLTDVKIGNAEYTIEYDNTKTDVDGNVFAKEFTFKFNSSLPTGTDYAVNASGAKSYAGVSMEAYAATLKTPGEPLPSELIVSDVSTDAGKITVEYFNNTGSTVTFNAVCAIYDAQNKLIDIKLLSVDNLEVGDSTEKEFAFADSWSRFKLYALSANNALKPVIKSYDSELAQ